MYDLDKKRHLLLRAGWGLNIHNFDEFISLSIPSLVDYLVKANIPQKYLLENLPYFYVNSNNLDKSQRRIYNQRYRLETRNLIADWILLMSQDISRPFINKVIYFWHTHFVCRISKSFQGLQYLDVLRENATGNFYDILLGVTKSSAMLEYLNGNQNVIGKPNENFARELLELFTLGIGNYTETDIREAARAFTGWRATASGKFRFVPEKHDHGKKTFLGQSGKWNGEDILRIILQQRACAKFIVTKVYRFFINSQVLDYTFIEELSEHFFNNNYNIQSLFIYMFNHSQFYEDRYFGSLIKSPVELVIGLFQILRPEFSEPLDLYRLMKYLNQIPLQPRNVGGWPEGMEWINSSSLLARMSLLDYLKGIKEIKFGYIPEDKSSNLTNRLKVNIRADNVLDLFKKIDKNGLINPEMMLIAPGINIEESLKNSIRDRVFRIFQLPEYQVC